MPFWLFVLGVHKRGPRARIEEGVVLTGLLSRRLRLNSTCMGLFVIAGLSAGAGQNTRSNVRSTQAAATAPFKTVTELDKCIWRIFHDSKGAYWFGSHGRGLYRWAGGKTFAHFTTESGLCDNDIGGIQEDRSGNVYISTSNGISKYDKGTFTTLKVDDSKPIRTELQLTPDILWFMCGGDQPHAVYYDGKSLRKLKVPTTADGDAFEARWPRSKFPNRRHSPYDAYTHYTDSRGNVWFGTASFGACRFDGKTFAWISESELGFDEKDNRSFGTRSIIEDRDGKFWITVTRYRFDMYPAGPATKSGGGLPP